MSAPAGRARVRSPSANRTPRPILPPDTPLTFGSATCFLCHRRLGRLTRSEEHVVPKWIQSLYGLQNQQLFLLNGTGIPYKALKVPCCRECNNEHLSALERDVAAAVREGHEAVRALDRYRLFLWLGKVFYGILRKELALPRDRAQPHLGRIAPRPLLEEFRLLHFLLQGARRRMDINWLQPEIRFPLASIFVVRTQLHPERLLRFNMRDALYPFCISLQLGEVGVIAALGDGGTIDVELAELFRKVGDHALHPMQFLELVSIVFYKASLFNRAPGYMIQPSGDSWSVTQNVLQGLTSAPMFDDWDERVFATLLARHTHRTVDEINPEPGRMLSFLRDDSGALPFVALGDHPWPDRPQPAPVPLAARRARAR